MRQGRKVEGADALKQFIIQYSGLALGHHEFEYEIDEKFFKEFEFSELQEGLVFLDLSLERMENMMNLVFAFSGHVRVTCDRCADDFDMPVAGEERLVVKFHHKEQITEEEDVLFLPYKAYEIDISNYVFEFIHLSLTIRRVHADEASCNQETVRKLSELNQQKQTDPRWDALNKLKDN